MPQGTLTIAANVLGLSSGTKSISGLITTQSAVGEVLDVALATGDNPISIPAGATAVMITPPAGNITAIKIKGATGDAGVLIHKTFPTLLALDPMAVLILNAAAALSATVELNFL